MNQKIQIALNRFGRHLRILREERNISIDKLSEITNIKQEYLSKIECGKAYRVMVGTHLIKISKALNVNLSELLDFE